MIKLYADENFPLVIVRQLRQIQYDVLTSYEVGQANQGITDDEVLAFATQTGKKLLVRMMQNSNSELIGIAILNDP